MSNSCRSHTPSVMESADFRGGRGHMQTHSAVTKSHKRRVPETPATTDTSDVMNATHADRADAVVMPPALAGTFAHRKTSAMMAQVLAEVDGKQRSAHATSFFLVQSSRK